MTINLKNKQIRQNKRRPNTKQKNEIFNLSFDGRFIIPVTAVSI